MSRRFNVFAGGGERDELLDVADGQIVRVKHKRERAMTGAYVDVTVLTFADGASETVWGTHTLTDPLREGID